MVEGQVSVTTSWSCPLEFICWIRVRLLGFSRIGILWWVPGFFFWKLCCLLQFSTWNVLHGSPWKQHAQTLIIPRICDFLDHSPGLPLQASSVRSQSEESGVQVFIHHPKNKHAPQYSIIRCHSVTLKVIPISESIFWFYELMRSFSVIKLLIFSLKPNLYWRKHFYMCRQSREHILKHISVLGGEFGWQLLRVPLCTDSCVGN